MYISEQGKQNLKKYKYIGSDNSFITPYLNPYWEFCAKLLPKWMAPNLITLLGFLLLVFNYFVTAYHCPNVEGEAPSWVYLTNALFLFIYQTLDAIDGKQARQTGSSSPLGELFDHGCDSISAMTCTMILASATQFGPTWMSYVVIVSVLSMFFFSIWEQYFTETLNFQSLSGPTEAQFMSMGIQLLTMFFGASFWTKNWVTLPGSLSLIPIQTRTIGITFLVISTLYGLLQCALTISKRFACDNDQELLNKKGSPLAVALPYLFLFCFFTAWLILSNDMIHQYTFAVCSVYGLLGAYVTSRLVLSRVCHEKSQPIYVILLPLPILTVNCLVSKFSADGNVLIDEFTLFVAYSIFVLLLYAHFIYSVIREICDFLGIYCFSLKYLEDKGKNESSCTAPRPLP